MCMSVSMCVHVYVRQGTCVLCMYVYRYLGSVCGSLALGLAPGGGCEGVNKENEEVLLSIDMSHSSGLGTHRRIHRTWRPQSETTGRCCFIILATGGPGPFSLSSPNSVGQSPLEPLPLAVKSQSQAAVLGVDADAASRQVKPGKGKVQSHGRSLEMRVRPRG